MPNSTAGVARITVHRELVWKCLRETSAEELTEANHPRLGCSKQSLNDVIFIRFSDKKLFTLATLKNLQND